MADQTDEDGSKQDWGAGRSSTPHTIRADIRPGWFQVEGPAESVRDIYRRAGLYTLLGNVVLAVTALLMLAIAAWVIVEAPAETAALAPWLAIPAGVLACGLGGFAVFRLSASRNGFALSGGIRHLRRS